MNRLEAIETFIAVVRFGGFSAASRQLGQPVATVSRKVALLEDQLDVRLLTRTTRHVTCTESGRLYFENCCRILDDLRDATEQVIGEYRLPKGELRVTAPFAFGHRHLQPVIHEFLRAHPEIAIDLQLADRVVPLVEEHVDCAVRISDLKDSALMTRTLGEILMVTAAAPSYLDHCGRPNEPFELAHHDCISWAALGPYKAWEFHTRTGAEELVPIRVRLSTSTPESAVAAAIAGLGIVQATSYQLAPAVQEGQLVPILRAFEPPPIPVNFVYPSRRLVPLKLRAFLDFTAPRLQQRLNDVATMF